LSAAADLKLVAVTEKWCSTLRWLSGRSNGNTAQ